MIEGGLTAAAGGRETGGAFVVSLDFELMWGVRDQRTIKEYGPNVLGARTAIGRLLDIFAHYGVTATWATVGLLFFDDRDELLASCPELKPTYDNPRLSPYSELSAIGVNERSDPYHFGLSLIRRIAGYPGQEIGTHTFSHFYCLEKGATIEAFAADLDAAILAANRKGFPIRSLVFPRNQYGSEFLRVAAERGLTAFRGNEHHPVYASVENQGLSKSKRMVKLADSYFNLTGHHVGRPHQTDGLTNIPSSRFLRPWSRWSSVFNGRKVERIRNAMTATARSGGIFHIWFHPHNLGADTDRNLQMLEHILTHYRFLEDECGMRSQTMAQVAGTFVRKWSTL